MPILPDLEKMTTAKKSLWTLRVSSDFSSAHQLRHYQGKCENLHGHNFSVILEVAGCELDSKTGMLVDFKVLKAFLNETLQKLDHTCLNELEPFLQINPSSEYLAQYIYRDVQRRLAAYSRFVWVRRVMVAEKESSQAWYQEGEPPW